MRYIFKHAYLVFLAYFLEACETQIISTSKGFPPYREEMLVHGLFSINNVHVAIQRSMPFNITDVGDTVHGLRVKLYADNSYLLTLVTQDDYNYFLPEGILLNDNSFFHIEIECPNQKILKSKNVKIPATPVIDTVIVNPYWTGEGGEVLFAFQNISKETHHYCVKILQYVNDVCVSNDSLTFGWNEVITVKEQSRIEGKQILVWQDRSVNKLEVRVYHLSDELARFLNSMLENLRTEGDAYSEDVVPVFTNLENGYGIWASYSYASRIILLNPGQ